MLDGARDGALPDDLVIRPISREEMEARIGALSDVLVDCVAGGASINFMADFTPQRADAFWRKIGEGVAAGAVDLLVAEHKGEVVGTVQVVAAPQDNQRHRADIAKMLVHRRARRLGIGRALMLAAEALARRKGKTLLVLDTVTEGDAARLYAALGWTAFGRVPGYALFPDGRPGDVTFFYKDLR